MIVLGSGILRCHSYERSSSRYGSVHLGVNHFFDDAPVGTKGILSVRILDVLCPMPDFNVRHGVAQVNVGDVLVLGEGELFTETMGRPGELYGQVGVKPDPPQEDNWMDRNELLRAENQRVEILFIPK